jgi:hypothetical protein
MPLAPPVITAILPSSDMAGARRGDGARAAMLLLLTRCRGRRPRGVCFAERDQITDSDTYSQSRVVPVLAIS